MSAHTPGPYGVPPWATGISIDGGPVIPLSLIAAAPVLLEALDNATAALESVMVHFQGRMPHGDVIGRRKVLDAARAAIRAARGESQ